jgi:hypothetical protein
MSIFAVDPVKVMVEATRTRLSDPMAKLMKDAKAEIKPLLLLQQGTTAVVSIKKRPAKGKTQRKDYLPGGEGPSTSGKDAAPKIAKNLLYLQATTEVARPAGSSKTAPRKTAPSNTAPSKTAPSKTTPINSKAAINNEPAVIGEKRKSLTPLGVKGPSTSGKDAAAKIAKNLHL